MNSIFKHITETLIEKNLHHEIEHSIKNKERLVTVRKISDATDCGLAHARDYINEFSHTWIVKALRKQKIQKIERSQLIDELVVLLENKDMLEKVLNTFGDYELIRIKRILDE